MSAATNRGGQFPESMKFLHWLTAALVLTMLCIGAGMLASIADYHRLVSVHRPLGIAILIVVAIRFVNRLANHSRLPAWPATVPPAERVVAGLSEKVLYTLLFLIPLVGWGMLSAAGYPIVMWGSFHLFPILPHDVVLYSFLRKTHAVLAYLLFFAFVAHFGGVLFHTVVLRDGLIKRMAGGRERA